MVDSGAHDVIRFEEHFKPIEEILKEAHLDAGGGPTFWGSSFWARAKKCLYLALLTRLYGFEPAKTQALVTGILFHAAMAFWYRTRDRSQALAVCQVVLEWCRVALDEGTRLGATRSWPSELWGFAMNAQRLVTVYIANYVQAPGGASITMRRLETMDPPQEDVLFVERDVYALPPQSEFPTSCRYDAVFRVIDETDGQVCVVLPDHKTTRNASPEWLEAWWQDDQMMMLFSIWETVMVPLGWPAARAVMINTIEKPRGRNDDPGFQRHILRLRPDRLEVWKAQMRYAHARFAEAEAAFQQYGLDWRHVPQNWASCFGMKYSICDSLPHCLSLRDMTVYQQPEPVSVEPPQAVTIEQTTWWLSFCASFNGFPPDSEPRHLFGKPWMQLTEAEAAKCILVAKGATEMLASQMAAAAAVATPVEPTPAEPTVASLAADVPTPANVSVLDQGHLPQQVQAVLPQPAVPPPVVVEPAPVPPSIPVAPQPAQDTADSPPVVTTPAPAAGPEGSITLFQIDKLTILSEEKRGWTYQQLCDWIFTTVGRPLTELTAGEADVLLTVLGEPEPPVKIFMKTPESDPATIEQLNALESAQMKVGWTEAQVGDLMEEMFHERAAENLSRPQMKQLILQVLDRGQPLSGDIVKLPPPEASPPNFDDIMQDVSKLSGHATDGIAAWLKTAAEPALREYAARFPGQGDRFNNITSVDRLRTEIAMVTLEDVQAKIGFGQPIEPVPELTFEALVARVRGKVWKPIKFHAAKKCSVTEAVTGNWYLVRGLVAMASPKRDETQRTFILDSGTELGVGYTKADTTEPLLCVLCDVVDAAAGATPPAADPATVDAVGGSAPEAGLPLRVGEAAKPTGVVKVYWLGRHTMSKKAAVVLQSISKDGDAFGLALCGKKPETAKLKAFTFVGFDTGAPVAVETTAKAVGSAIWEHFGTLVKGL
ncbi:MAG: hypothetical protein M0R22_00065 [Dehalococcoidia bacterium]|jgi:hypothetical protein|nr:hypothetical protein [Dehalococcoidia bacterium]